MNRREVEKYRAMIDDCIEGLGSARALGRQLGIGHSTITNRIKNPETIKREHIYALEHIHQRITR